MANLHKSQRITTIQSVNMVPGWWVWIVLGIPENEREWDSNPKPPTTQTTNLPLPDPKAKCQIIEVQDGVMQGFYIGTQKKLEVVAKLEVFHQTQNAT